MKARKDNSESVLIVGKHINDISLNPLECLLDAKSYVIAFDSENQIKRFLKHLGYTDNQIYNFTITDCMVSCLNCEHEFVLTKLYRDGLGWFTACPECKNSFDVDIVPFRNRSRKVIVKKQEEELNDK
ncbi:MAG: hypothetical protein LBI03_06265 [Clostridiales bacterium]|jgi:hypothetical protein|nr:hypothetical protein [Clostridiales bacterium]